MGKHLKPRQSSNLTDEQKQDIYNQWIGGTPKQNICKQYGLTDSLVASVVQSVKRKLPPPDVEFFSERTHGYAFDFLKSFK